jgi:hypothetical protein
MVLQAIVTPRAAYANDEMKNVEVSYAPPIKKPPLPEVDDVNRCNIAFAEAQQVSSPPDSRSLFIQIVMATHYQYLQ